MYHRSTYVLTVALRGSLLDPRRDLGAPVTDRGDSHGQKSPTPGAGTQPQEQRAETTTTTETSAPSPGIIGSAFQLVWAVVSFPFRVIGDLS